jgi:hypothetical protein
MFAIRAGMNEDPKRDCGSVQAAIGDGLRLG